MGYATFSAMDREFNKWRNMPAAARRKLFVGILNRAMARFKIPTPVSERAQPAKNRIRQ